MIETLLLEATSLRDNEARSRIINKIANHSEETLDELISVLQDPESPLVPTALQVIQAIGYPKNASAIPVILWYIQSGTAPLFEEAVQIMLAMDTSVLASIVQMAQEDDNMDAIVINAFSRVGYYVFVQLKEKAEMLAKQVVQALANHPEESSGLLLYVLSNPIKVWWEVAVKTISAIGYPRNASAIPLLIAHACLGNDLAEKEAIQALVALGPHIVVPYLLQALWDQGYTGKYLSISAADLSWLLLDPAMGSEYLVPCGPVVSHLLRQMSSDQPVLKEKLLHVLERIGPQCAIYALPTLLHFLKEEGPSELGLQIQQFINNFSQEALAPYTQILASLLEQPE